MIVAIDGTSGSGKSTISKILAKELGINRFNVGMIYRALTKFFMDKNISPSEIADFDNIKLGVFFVQDEQFVEINGISYDNNELRSTKISSFVPKYAENQRLREIVRSFQRNYASKNDVLMEGRDITSEVLPDADHKFFITCSYLERAKRRTKDLLDIGENVLQKDVVAKLFERDLEDATRKISPLKLVEGVKVIDTSCLSIEETVRLMKKEIGGEYAL